MEVITAPPAPALDAGPREPPSRPPPAGGFRGIAMPSRVVALVREPCAAVLLSQLLYWTRRGTHTVAHGGWIFKSSAQLQQETGLSWKVQHRARAVLLAQGWIEERKEQMPARLAFRVRLEALGAALGTPLGVAGADTRDWSSAGLARCSQGEWEELVGRSFLFHTALTQLWPVPTALMCSRLLAGMRLPPGFLSVSASSPAEPAAPLPALAALGRRVALHRDQWHAETGLSRDQWQTARRHLRDAGVLIEQARNFPRRVDLSIDLGALMRLWDRLRPAMAEAAQAAVVKTPPKPERAAARDWNPPRQASLLAMSPAPGSRWDREKQPGGFGGAEWPQVASPDPAHKRPPIPPLSIDRFHPYWVWNDIELHPPLQPREPIELGVSRCAFQSFGYAAWNISAVEIRWPGRSGPRHCASEPAARHDPANASKSALHWPDAVAACEQGPALLHLRGLAPAVQQQVLDEVGWCGLSGKGVRSPVALVRVLAQRAHSGHFVAEGAHRVALLRERQAGPPMSPSTPPPPAPLDRVAVAQARVGRASQCSPQNRARLIAVRDEILRQRSP